MTLQSVVEVSRDGEVIETLSFAQGLIRIGRTPQVKDGPIDVVLASDRVSGLHAQIVVSGAELTLVDRSRNGTFVNGELVQAPRPLGPADTIEIDVFSLRCRSTLAEVGVTPATIPIPVTSALPESPVMEVSSDDLEFDLAPEDDELPTFEIGPELAALPPSPRPREPSRPAPSELDPGETLGGVPPTLGDAPGKPFAAAGTLDVDGPMRPLHVLGELYRHLAGRFGAGWGRPPRLDAGSLPRALEAARQAIAGRASDLVDSALWTEWLARELCGLDPIHTLLEDATVTGIDVHGDHRITVHRGFEREAAAIRYSCVEALLAAIERWTGRRLDTAPIDHVAAGVTLRAFDQALVPDGPLVVVRRATGAGRSLADLVAANALPEAAAELLQGSLASGHGILIHGGSRIDPSELVTALRRELPPERVVAAIQRASTWPPSLALTLDGHQESAALWRCVERLGPDWLIVEDLQGPDVAPLRDLGRHRGGGTLATMQARSGEAALTRLAALLAASAGGELSACRAAIASSFDLVLGLRERANGGIQVHSISELRARGELAELFAWRPVTSSLEATGIDSHLSR